MSTILEVRSLRCGYSPEFFLQDINFHIKTGELFGIIGPNGSGKTTLLKTLTRLIRPISGEIIFKEANIWKTEHGKLSRDIAVVSQASHVVALTVEEFVLLGRIPHYRGFQFLETKDDLDIAGQCMEMTGMSGFKNREMDRLSGGERQLAFMARALCQQPQLLLLDEPTNHLDITHQALTMDLVRKLNRELGLTAIMVLHDLNLTSEYCDRLLLLNKGEMHSIGTPAEVLTYRIIEDVYKTVVIVKENPMSGKPYVFLVSKAEDY